MSYFDQSLCCHSDIEVALKYDAAMERFQDYCKGISNLLTQSRNRKVQVEAQINLEMNDQKSKGAKNTAKVLLDELFELLVTETVNVEVLEMIDIRCNQNMFSKPDPIMVEQQEMVIADAYKESNFLRAKLLHLYTSSHALGENIVLYIKINQAERNGNNIYHTRMKAQAVKDCNLTDRSLCIEGWKKRIKSDELVILYLTNILKEDYVKESIILRTKWKYNFNRAKAILKADTEGLELLQKGIH